MKPWQLGDVDSRLFFVSFPCFSRVGWWEFFFFYPMYSKQLKVGLVVLYFVAAQKVVCARMHLLLYPVTVLLSLARVSPIDPGLSPRL